LFFFTRILLFRVHNRAILFIIIINIARTTQNSFATLVTMTGATTTTATTAGGSNSKFSSKLKGLKFMQRAQEKKTGNAEKETTTTTTTTTTTARTTTTTTTNDEHWTYENPEQYERARKQKALKEQLREKKTMSSPQWVFGRRSFGGFNKAIEAMAREQEERQMKAKLAIRDARNSKVDKKKNKNKKMSSKKSTTPTATNRKKK